MIGWPAEIRARISHNQAELFDGVIYNSGTITSRDLAEIVDGENSCHPESRRRDRDLGRSADLSSAIHVF